MMQHELSCCIMEQDANVSYDSFSPSMTSNSLRMMPSSPAFSYFSSLCSSHIDFLSSWCPCICFSLYLECSTIFQSHFFSYLTINQLKCHSLMDTFSDYNSIGICSPGTKYHSFLLFNPVLILHVFIHLNASVSPTNLAVF